MEVIKLCFYVHCCCFWKMYINLCVMFLFVLYDCCKNCEHFLGANGELLYKSKVFSIVLKWFFFFLNVCVFLVMVCSSYVRVIYCHDPSFGLTIKGKGIKGGASFWNLLKLKHTPTSVKMNPNTTMWFPTLRVEVL